MKDTISIVDQNLTDDESDEIIKLLDDIEDIMIENFDEKNFMITPFEFNNKKYKYYVLWFPSDPKFVHIYEDPEKTEQQNGVPVEIFFLDIIKASKLELEKFLLEWL